MNEDFRCPFCKKETNEFSEDILHNKIRFKNLTDKKVVYCPKHSFLLYEREHYGGGFFKQEKSRWVFLKKVEPTEFECKNCIYWNLKKGIEDINGINKVCELGLQKRRENAGFTFCQSCKEFKFNFHKNPK